MNNKNPYHQSTIIIKAVLAALVVLAIWGILERRQLKLENERLEKLSLIHSQNESVFFQTIKPLLSEKDYQRIINSQNNTEYNKSELEGSTNKQQQLEQNKKEK